MAHWDSQQVTAFAIVAVAALSIGRRLWNQALAFRKRPARRNAKRPAPKPSAASIASPLIQIQVKPPVHLKRPPTSDS